MAFTTIPTRTDDDTAIPYEDTNSLMANTQYFKDAITVDSGNVGLGTTPDSGYKLHLYNSTGTILQKIETEDTNNSGILFISDSEGSPRQCIVGVDYTNNLAKINYGGSISGYNGIAIDPSGNVGLGTDTSGSYQLELSTDTAFKLTTTTWSVTSDERLKENIELADLDSCYNIIKNLPLKRFRWKDSVFSDEEVQDRTRTGWIAQDVESVFPKSIKKRELKIKEKDENGKNKKNKDNEEIISKILDDCMNMDADQIYATMYGAIQKLIEKVEKLEAQCLPKKKKS